MKYLKSVLIIPLFFSIIGTHLTGVDNNTNKGIYYDNFKYTDNVIFNSSKGTDVDYSANLKYVGDYYEITFDVINDSNYDVEISDYIIPDSNKYLEYDLSYLNDKEVSIGDVLKQGEAKTIKYKVLYKNQINVDHYEFNPYFSINYEQLL